MIPQISYVEAMKRRTLGRILCALPAVYAVALWMDVCFGDSSLPEPGSRGDTLTVEDRRMAYLVYNLLDSNGMILGADLARGEKLFMRNCRPCHGDDGRRMNLSGDMRRPHYIGTTAHDEAPTFWFMMNFGDSIRGMLPYIDEIPLADMVDLAGFAQTLPRLPWTREELVEVEKANALRKEEREKERLKEKARSP